MIPIIKTENDLRKLAGLALRETSVQLDDIVDKHANAMASVMNGETSLYDHQEFYDELYDYFINSGEMPYGIAKARDGDPDQWIQEYLEDEYGSERFTEPMDGDFDSAMASAGHGTDEDYGSYEESAEPCPEPKAKKMPKDWFKKHGKKVGGFKGESTRRESMNHFAKVVANGNRSVQVLTENAKEEVVVEEAVTGLQAYMNKLEEGKDESN